MWLRNIWSTKLLKSNPESNNSANFLEFTLFYTIHHNCENMFFLVFWKIPQNMNNILWTCQYQRWLATRVGVDKKNSKHDEAICSVLFSVKISKVRLWGFFRRLFFNDFLQGGEKFTSSLHLMTRGKYKLWVPWLLFRSTFVPATFIAFCITINQESIKADKGY